VGRLVNQVHAKRPGVSANPSWRRTPLAPHSTTLRNPTFQSTATTCLSFFLLTGSCYVAQAGLELLILLPHTPRYWDYSSVPPYPFNYNFSQELTLSKPKCFYCHKNGYPLCSSLCVLTRLWVPVTWVSLCSTVGVSILGSVEYKCSGWAELIRLEIPQT
jgi:hypothetical protein